MFLVFCYQDETFLHGRSRHQGIKNAQAVAFRVELEKLIGPVSRGLAEGSDYARRQEGIDGREVALIASTHNELKRGDL